MSVLAALAIVVLIAAAVAAGLVVYQQRARGNPNDREVLESLRREGSDLTKPHFVEFFLHFPTRTAALCAAEAIEAAGFKTGVGPGPATAYHVLVASKEMVPVESELGAIRARFNAIAVALGGTYEFWLQLSLRR